MWGIQPPEDKVVKAKLKESNNLKLTNVYKNITKKVGNLILLRKG